MAELKAQIVRFTDPGQPGVVVAEFFDANGKLHSIEDKVPVLSLEDLDASSSYPRDTMLQGEVIELLENRIRIRLSWGVEDSEGNNTFVVPADQIQWKGFLVEYAGSAYLIRLESEEGTNTLSRERVLALTDAISKLHCNPKPLIIAGNQRYFSAGADIREVAALTAATAYEFGSMGQALMNAVAAHPAPTYAAIQGFCMGGGLDLALSCSHRIAAPHSIFGHRGASLGIITGWGGTQRLPELIGKARALQMFLCAEKVNAAHALEIHLVDAIADDPVAEALLRAQQYSRKPQELT